MGARRAYLLLLAALIGTLVLVGNELRTYPLSFDFNLAHAQNPVPRLPMNASINTTKVTSVEIHNSSSINASKVGQPALVGNITAGSLKKVNISFNPLHAKVIPEPVSRNSTETAILKREAPFVKNPTNKTIVTLRNITNSSVLSPTDPVKGGPHSMSYFIPNGTLTAPRAINIIYGLTYDESGGNVPPDVQVAVGPRHVVELVNLAGETWLKGSPSSIRFPLGQFFHTGSDNISDPRIIYDTNSGRFFASILDRSTSSVKLDVSTTNDPTGKWIVYDFPFSDCPDQPMIATSIDKFVISANDVKSTCIGDVIGAQYTIVDKGDLLTGFNKPRFWQSQANISQFSVLPIDSPNSTLFMASVGSQGSNLVTMYKVTGKVPFLSIGKDNLPVKTINMPSQALEPLIGSTINVGDARLLEGAMSGVKIWLTFNDGCMPAGDRFARSCVGLIQIDTTKNKVIQDFDISSPGTYFYYPAIALDDASNLNIIFGMSSQTIYPSLYIAGQKGGIINNTLTQAVNFTIGGGVSRSGFYGDYFGIAQDPSAPQYFLVAGEYNPSAPGMSGIDYWATLIGNFTSTTPSVPAPRHLHS
jgi:hypothetical protein